MRVRGHARRGGSGRRPASSPRYWRPFVIIPAVLVLILTGVVAGVYVAAIIISTP